MQFSYEILPRQGELGGGWRLRLLEGDIEVGGGVFPPEGEDADALQDAFNEAESEAYAWLQSREEVSLSGEAPDPRAHLEPLAFEMRAAQRQALINRQTQLDIIKHQLACEVVERFSIAEIKARSRANIERWRSQGTYGQAYADWEKIIDDPDDSKMIAAMVGMSERANQLRQSPPYVGMIDQVLVRKYYDQGERFNMAKVAPSIAR